MESGLLFIDKKEGVTSRYVDNRLQRLFHTPKVGHLGTLDPFATGLLIVAVGASTKYLPFLPDEEKTYQAVLHLGVATDTGDLTGTKTIEKPVGDLSLEAVKEALSSFRGDSTQIPPMTSAIKKDGTPLYRLAHQGKEIEREPRPIHIEEIRLLCFDGKDLRFEATVSKGTYVRVLGEDIAARLGTVGHLMELRRIRIGALTLEGAIDVEEADASSLRDPAAYVPYPRVELQGEQIKKARNGVALSFELDAPRLLLTREGQAIAIYEKEGEAYRCLRGL